MNKKRKKISIFLILVSSFFTMGFTTFSSKPQTVYRVYLKGKSIGIIQSKISFENYIDEKQAEIKKIYNVNQMNINMKKQLYVFSLLYT